MKATLQLFVHRRIVPDSPKAASYGYHTRYCNTGHPITEAIASRHSYYLYTLARGKIPSAMSPSHNYCIHNSDCTAHKSSIHAASREYSLWHIFMGIVCPRPYTDLTQWQINQNTACQHLLPKGSLSSSLLPRPTPVFNITCWKKCMIGQPEASHFHKLAGLRAIKTCTVTSVLCQWWYSLFWKAILV